MNVTNSIKKLSEIKIGTRAVIISVSNQDIYLKLMEMGCIPGEEVKVDHIAPLGGPMAIQVAGYNLSLRIDEAESILVNEI